MYSLYEELNKIDDSKSLEESSVAYHVTVDDDIYYVQEAFRKTLHERFPKLKSVLNHEVFVAFDAISDAVKTLYAENEKINSKERADKEAEETLRKTPLTPEEEKQLIDRLRKTTSNSTNNSDTTSNVSKLKKTFSELDI